MATHAELAALEAQTDFELETLNGPELDRCYAEAATDQGPLPPAVPALRAVPAVATPNNSPNPVLDRYRVDQVSTSQKAKY